MDKFNDNLEQFTNTIKLNYPEQSSKIDEYYDYSDPGDKYLTEFIQNCSTIGDDISCKNEIIFSKDRVILNNIDFYTIWNDEKLTDVQKENIWKYLHTLYIFAYEHIKNVDFKTVIKELKQMGSDENVDEYTRTFMNIIDSLTYKYKEETNSVEEEDNNKPGSFNIPTPELFNGVIGNLAKEIAEEIDPEKINLDNPGELLKSLLSGNFDENNDDSGVMNLIKDITGKIQNKISSGKLNENDLFNEAQNVMKSFGGNGNSSADNPLSMFNNMMQSGMMAGMDTSNNDVTQQATSLVKEASNRIAENMGSQPSYVNMTENQVQLKNTRDRLRKKLEEKKRILHEKEKEKALKNNSIKTVQEDIDLDALADEIDGL